MARTVQVIYDQMIEEKETKANLAGLLPSDPGPSFEDLLDDITSLSKVANWRLWIYLHAFATFVLETLFDTFKADVELIKAQAQYGTDPWWIDRIFEFQLGDTVIDIVDEDGKIITAYDPIDESKRIVAAAAILTSAAGIVTIKVAKESGGELVIFDTAEVTSINSYKNRIQPTGERITVISLNADLIKIFADIFFDAQFDLSIIEANVEAAITDYLTSLSLTSLSGTVNTNKLIDAVQAVEGVNDIDINDMQAKPAGGVFVVIDREYDTSAGYVKTDPAFLLADTLTYVAQ